MYPSSPDYYRDFEMHGKRCVRVWDREWWANRQPDCKPASEAILIAEGAEAQRIYDNAMREYELSAMCCTMQDGKHQPGCPLKESTP